MRFPFGCLLLIASVLITALPITADAQHVCISTPAAQDKPVRTDKYGVALPEGSIARLGKLGLRQASRNLAGVAVSVNAKFIATSGTQDPFVHVWDAATGREVRKLEANGLAGSGALTFSPDGSMLAASGVAIVVWDMTTGKELQRWRNPRIAGPLAFADGGSTVVACTEEGTVISWDVKSGKDTATWDASAALGTMGRTGCRVIGGQFSPTGDKLALTIEVVTKHDSGISTRELVGAVWDVAGRKLLWRVENGGVWHFTADGKMVAYRESNTICLCETVSGNDIKTIPLAPDRAIDTLALAPDGTKLLATFDRALAQVWDLKTGKVVKDFALPDWELGRADEFSALFLPDNQRVLFMANDQLLIWDTKTGQEVEPWEGHRTTVTYLAFAADGKRLLSGSGGSWRFSQRFLTWDSATWNEIDRRLLPRAWLDRVVPISPDFAWSIVGHQDGTLHLHDAVTDQPLRTLRKFDLNKPVNRGQQSFISPSGKLMVLKQGNDSPPVLIDLGNGKLLCQLAREADLIRFAFAWDDRRVAWFGLDGSIYVLDVATGKTVWRLNAAPKMATGFSWEERKSTLAFAEDGRHLIACSALDHNVRVWDLNAGKLHRVLMERQRGAAAESLCAPAMSPDGKTIALSLVPDRNDVELWEVATARLRGRLQGHQKPVTALAFSPDGKLLVSGSEDTTILVWDIDRLAQPPQPPTAKDLERLWTDLGDEDAQKAFRAVLTLASAPAEATFFIKARLEPVAPVDPKRLEQWLNDLNDEKFAARESATLELEKLGEQARQTMEKKLQTPLTLETRRRLEGILAKLDLPHARPELLRSLRALEVLDRIGTSAAQQHMAVIAKGAPQAVLTREAQAAMARRSQRGKQ